MKTARILPALIAILFVAVLLVACSSDSESPAAANLEIPFEKYTLDNGLQVILHEDHSDPIVAMATVVHVGSSREKPGRTGFAHFFEHMSFNDSENVPQGANRKMIGEWGGTRNGGTWSDGTIYFEVVPKDALEKLMWIDSDRLGFMINTVTDSALENEKQVVKNEKRQRIDNQPYGHTESVILKNLYPADHPYSWSVIGSLEDLQSATLDDVGEFYDQYYGPNNATLVVAGDIDRDDVKALVESWFGEIAQGPDIPSLEPRPVTLGETRSLFYVDNFAKLPEIRLTFPTVEQYHADSYALDVLGEILSEGKRAPLYKVIVEEKRLAPEARAGHEANEIAGTFTIRVRANAGVALDDVKAAIDESLERFAADAFSDADLERIKVALERQFYESISSVLGKAFRLAQYNIFAGDPGFVTEDLNRVKAVTREQVMEVFDRYIKDHHYVMTSFVPRGGESLIASGATVADVVEEQIVQGAEKAIEKDPDFRYEVTETQHDRSEPDLRETPRVNLPEVWTAETGSGMKVLGIEHDELPLVEFTLRLKGGLLLDSPDKTGAASLLAELMMEGTANRTPEELEDAIGELGADIEISSDRESLSIGASTLSRNYEAVVDLVREMLLEPRWDEAEFDRLKRSRLTLLKQREGDPRAIASLAFFKQIYGAGHVFSNPTEGTTETVSGISLDDLKAWYAANVSPKVAAFHVAGAVEQDRVIKSAKALSEGWDAKEVLFPSYELEPVPAKPRVYFVDLPDAKQSVIMIGKLAVPGNDPDYARLAFSNNRLGAGSSARLFQLLRIQKGYTYGAGSFIPRSFETAPFIARSSVRANVTLESLQLFREQLESYAATYTEEDLATTRNLLTKQATRDFETLGDLMEVLKNISHLGLPTDYIEAEQREENALTLADVREMIGRHMNESQMVYVIVGDGRTQRQRIKDLGHGEPIELDIFGERI